MNPQKTITWVAGILTFCLTTFSFVLSFQALTDLAKQNNVSVPPLFPLVVEAAVIVFSLVTLSRSMKGLSTGYNWTLIITSSLLAGFFNVAHSYPNKLGMFMASMPSLFLLLSFESFLSLLKDSFSDQNDKENVTHKLIQDLKNLKQMLVESNNKVTFFENENVTLRTNFEMLQNKIKEENVTKNDGNKKQTNKVTERREKVLKMLDSGNTQDEIAKKLNVSQMTILRDVKELNGKVKSI